MFVAIQLTISHRKPPGFYEVQKLTFFCEALTLFCARATVDTGLPGTTGSDFDWDWSRVWLKPRLKGKGNLLAVEIPILRIDDVILRVASQGGRISKIGGKMRVEGKVQTR